MNILFIHPVMFHPQRGGIERVSDLLCREFIRRAPRAGAGFLPHAGHNIHLHVLYRPGSLYDGRSLRCAHAEGKSASARTASVF